MQFLYDKQVVVKRYSSTLGEFNRPNKTLVEVGTYECHTAESSTTTAQLQPQKKNTTDLTLYTDPEAPIKRGDILYIYELDEYDKPIMSTLFIRLICNSLKLRTHNRLIVLIQLIDI